MDTRTRQAAITALLEGIASAQNAVASEGLSAFEEAAVLAEAALASLEAAGFKVVQDKPHA